MGHSLFALWSRCGGAYLSLAEIFFSLQIKGSPGEHDNIFFFCAKCFSLGISQLGERKNKKAGITQGKLELNVKRQRNIEAVLEKESNLNQTAFHRFSPYGRCTP